LSTPFQNRLVGTIIVAAAAIIFLPDLLNGEKRSQKDTFEAIPPAPINNNVTVIKKFPTKNLSRIAKEPITDDIALDEQINPADKSNQIGQTSIVAKATKEDKFKTIKNQSDNVIDKNTAQKKLQSQVTKTVKTRLLADKSSNKKALIDKAVPSINTKYAWVIQLGSFRERHNVDSLIRKLQKNGYTAFSRPIKTRHGNLIKVFVGPELSKALLEKKLEKLKKLTNTQGKIARFNPAS